MNNYLNKTIDKIVKKFDGYTDKQKIVVYILIVILLIISVSFLSNLHLEKGIIDYKNFNFEIEKENYLENEDRKVYLQSEDIISNIIASYFGNYYIEGKKVKPEDFYNWVMYVDYKNKISSGEFKNKIKEISENFKAEYGVENPSELKDSSIIRNIYIYEKTSDMYMVEIEVNKVKYYFGIRFLSNNRYTVFYIGN